MLSSVPLVPGSNIMQAMHESQAHPEGGVAVELKDAKVDVGPPRARESIGGRSRCPQAQI